MLTDVQFGGKCGTTADFCANLAQADAVDLSQSRGCRGYRCSTKKRRGGRTAHDLSMTYASPLTFGALYAGMTTFGKWVATGVKVRNAQPLESIGIFVPSLVVTCRNTCGSFESCPSWA